MALHYIFGASGAGKSYLLYRTILREAHRNPREKYLVIVPEQFTLQTQKDFVTLDEQIHGIMNIDVLSFLRLAYRVFEQTGVPERIVLEDTGKSMIVKKIAMQCADRLEVFGRNVRKSGFLDEIKSVISEFYQYGIGREELEQMQSAAEGKTALKKKLHDIRLLYEGFEDFLADRYVTTEGVLGLLTECLPQSGLVKNCTICFDGFTGFTPSQYQLIGELMRYAKECYVTVTMPRELVGRVLPEHDLFYLSSKTVQWLDRLAVQRGLEIAEPVCVEGEGRFGAAKSLKFLSQHIFRPLHHVFEEAQEAVRIFSHKNLREEAVWTVTEIYRLVHKEGYRYRDIAVVCADLDSFSAVLEEEFARAGLPCFLDCKKRILDNPVVEIIFAVLEVVTQNFSYDAVMHYLKSPLSGFSQEESDLLENYIRALGIKYYSGYEKEWTRKYRSAYECPLARLNELRVRFVGQWREFYAVMGGEKAVTKERMKALYYFLAERGAEQYLAECAKNWETQEPLRAREYEQLWRISLEIFDRIVALLGEDELSLKEFQEILETGFAEAKVGLVPPGIDTVLVGDMERTRLKDIRVLFFLGINEGVVPKPAKGGGVLSEQDRLLLADAGIELAPNQRQTAFLSEFYLYLNLTKPSEKLYLSWHRVDAAGKTVLPSYLLGRVERLFKNLHSEVVQEGSIEKYLGTDAGFRSFLKSVPDYLDGKKELPGYFRELYQAYFTGKLQPPIPRETIAAAVYYRKQEQPLTAQNAKMLYGERLYGSVTRLEQYAQCAFAHFLKYGLALEERAEYELKMPDIGSIYHAALQYFSAAMKERGQSWHDGLTDISSELLKSAIEQAAAEYGNGIFASSSRSKGQLDRIERMLRRTIKTVQSQIAAGDFEPEVFELEFEHADRYLSLKGRIDRIDLCHDGQKDYLRVVDYKSGTTEFKLDKLYYGLQLQLAVYLEAALTWAREKGMTGVVPAGMLYYRINDPIVAKGKDVDYEIGKALAMKGLVSASGDALFHQDHALKDSSGQLAAGVASTVIPVSTLKGGGLSKRSMAVQERILEKAMEHARETLYENAGKIEAGDVDPAPYRQNGENACQWCSYKSCCTFDRKCEGYEYRDLEKIPVLKLWENEGEERKENAELDGRTETGNTAREP